MFAVNKLAWDPSTSHLTSLNSSIFKPMGIWFTTGMSSRRYRKDWREGEGDGATLGGRDIPVGATRKDCIMWLWLWLWLGLGLGL